MSLSIVAAFWMVSVLLVITPGVDWGYVISAGIRGKVVLPAVGGLLLGHFIATCLVAAGVGALLNEMPFALSILTVAGACYLLWLGIGLIRNPVAPASAISETPDSAMQWLLKGLGASILNPKLYLFFLALLPQFSDPQSTWPLSRQMLALGGIHLVSCCIIYLLVGYGSQIILQTRPVAAQRVSWFSGIAMTGIALALLAEPIFHSI